MGIAVPVTQLPCNITSQLSQASLLSALQQNFAAIVAGLQATQGYCNNAVAPVIDLSSVANSEILGSQVAGFARPSVAYTEEGVQVQTHIPRYEQIDTNDFLYGLLMEEGTSNLLSANQSHPTSTTGFTVTGYSMNSGASMSYVTSQTWAGIGCLQVVTTALAYEGIETTGISASANTVYTASVRVLAPAGASMALVFHDQTNNVNTEVNFIGTGAWQTVTATLTTGTSAASVWVMVQTQTATAVTFYVDGIQVEPLYSTSWITGGTTRSPESMIIPTAGIFTPGSWTVEMRYIPKDTTNQTQNNKVLWGCVIDSNDYYEIGVGWSGNLYLRLYSSGTKYEIDTAYIASIGTEYIICAAGNGSNLTFMINGIQVGSIAYVEPVGTLPAWMNIGGTTETSGNPIPCNGILDDLRISNIAHTITDHKNYISSNQPLPVDANTTLKMDFDQTLRQTSVQRLTNIQGTFTIADALTTSDPSKATHIVPTGWTTAEATIMQAMSELPATGGSIVLLDGTFKVDNTTWLSIASVSVSGQGVSTVIMPVVSVTCLFKDIGALTNLVLASFSINGNSYGAYGIQISSSGCIISSTAINNLSGYGAVLIGNNNTVTNSIVNACGSHGIEVQSSNNTITNNQVLGCSLGSGISVSGSYNTINNNQCNNNNQHGIYLSGSHNTVSGNNCQGNSQGTNNLFSGIAVYSGGYNNIQGNTCRKGSGPNYPYAGITIATGTTNLVSSNDCYTGGATAGISDSGTSTNFGSGNRVNSGAWSTTPS